MKRYIRVTNGVTLTIPAPERGHGGVAVVALGRDVDCLLLICRVSLTFSLVVLHALGSRVFVLCANQPIEI